MKTADRNSKRSQRRVNRGFRSLEVSTRKHRRALERSIQKRTFDGKLLNPGDKTEHKQSGFEMKAGGSIKYH